MTVFDGIILMGPFGAGKTYLGRHLHLKGVGSYTELEPILFERFADGNDLDVNRASAYIREHYDRTLNDQDIEVGIFESTGLVQRPWLLEIMSRYTIALVKVQVPKATSLARVARRNAHSHSRISPEQASDFYDRWLNEVAPDYDFSLEVDGTDVDSACEAITTYLGQTSSGRCSSR